MHEADSRTALAAVSIRRDGDPSNWDRAGPVGPGCDHGVMSRSDRAVFRLPIAALGIPVLAAFCVTPLATAGGAWIWVYALPVLALLYVLLTRTVADRTGLRTGGPTGFHAMAWPDMDGMEFRGSRWAVAVGHDGRRLRLPMVRPRDLPRLAAVSGGHLDLDRLAAGTGDESSGDVSAAATVPSEDAVAPSGDAVAAPTNAGPPVAGSADLPVPAVGASVDGPDAHPPATETGTGRPPPAE